MRRPLIVSLLTFVVSVMCVAPGAADASNPDAPWRGDEHVQPAAYGWLSDDYPLDTYTITIVRGMRSTQVLRTLGGVKNDLGDDTPGEAARFQLNHVDSDYEGPPVVQVQRLGNAVVVYEPFGFRSSDASEQLSRRGVVASFSTTVELDTYVSVARGGRTLRNFDAGFKPPEKGALPQEAGLDWGAEHENTFATAWAFDERVTRIHISREWFLHKHPTYVLQGQ